LLPGTISREQEAAKQLINKILHGTGPVTGSALTRLQSVLRDSGQSDDGQSLQNLMSYLLR
jgi:hypothetical protein